MYDWSEELQGIILGVFFIPYVLIQLPSGLMAERWSGKFIVVGGSMITALILLLTPAVVSLLDAPGLILTQLLMGVAQSGIGPAITTIMAAWIPVQERGIVGAVVFNGYAVIFYYQDKCLLNLIYYSVKMRNILLVI